MLVPAVYAHIVHKRGDISYNNKTGSVWGGWEDIVCFFVFKEWHN